MLYVTAVYTLGLFMSATITTRRYLATRRMRRGGLLPSPRHAGAVRTPPPAGRPPAKKVIWKISERAGEVVLTRRTAADSSFSRSGLINTLSTGEVEGHPTPRIDPTCAGNDPLWNAVQELIRTLFFYHPAGALALRPPSMSSANSPCDDRRSRHYR